MHYSQSLQLASRLRPLSASLHCLDRNFMDQAGPGGSVKNRDPWTSAAARSRDPVPQHDLFRSGTGTAFAATYNRTRRIEHSGQDRTKSSSLEFSLNGIQQIVRAFPASSEVVRVGPVTQFFQEAGDRFLDKLVLERLLGRKFCISNPCAWAAGPEICFTRISAASFDIEIDLQRMPQWAGRLHLSDLRLEIHLQQISVSDSRWPGADGQLLQQLGARTVDTGRYLVAFLDATTLTVHDKQTRLSTTIWGDPHVDLSDQEGRVNGEFSDLVKSDIRTTMVLLDETRVVVTAPDSGVLQTVDVFKNGSHVRGVGAGHPRPEAKTPGPKAAGSTTTLSSGVFLGVDRNPEARRILTEPADLVRAGGDGNDWYDEYGRLVWGGGA